MVYLLPDFPTVSPDMLDRISRDYSRFGAGGLPDGVEAYILDQYSIDIGGEYAGRPIRNPFGKASGQLSLSPTQVKADARAGLGFVVLKTVIAQDDSGEQSMKEWAMKETHMKVEPVAGRSVGRLGWTVTWKGRGWHDTFEAYCRLYAESLAIGQAHGMPVAASVKYHLPGPGEHDWREEEYRHTTRALLNLWAAGGDGGPMILEKDFSPTLAGDARSKQQETILQWMSTCPRLIREAAGVPVMLGLKVMNAMFGDAFQLELTRAAAEAGPDFLVYANRLFDPEREFEGKVGVAYGGPDLSHRNLRLLSDLRAAEAAGEVGAVPPISGTGDVCSGKMAVEYGLRGATSVQLHTFFQLPDLYYGMQAGSRTEKALHQLLFDPVSGLITWMLHVKERRGISRFRDLVQAAGTGLR